MTSATTHVRVEQLPLPSMSPGTTRAITVLRYGDAGARPKAYFQASLHADEVPAMLVAQHLGARLEAAAAAGEVSGEVVLVPVANPPGLAQFVNGGSLGRYALDGSGNFNRHFPDPTDGVARRLEGRLGDDAAANVALVREAMAAELAEHDPAGEVGALRVGLLRLASDADIALDLHCDSEAVLHLYLGTPLWPDAADLSAQLGSRATLLATLSGGNPFDEAVAGPWWHLAERFPAHPIPAACLAGTVELRGRADVSKELAARDADNLFRFLQRRGVLAGDPGAPPEPLCDATPLAGVDMIRARSTGVIDYAKSPGEVVGTGEVVATVIDPLERDLARARTRLVSSTDGVLYGRKADRLARPGAVVCKVAGRVELPGREAGALLTD